MIKGIIFDLDGVIVSTDELHYKAWKKMAEKEKIEFDYEINHRLRGVSRADSLEIILEKSKKIYQYEEKEELLKFKNDEYLRLLETLNETSILSNVIETLDELKSKNYFLAIGSSSKNARIILDKIGLTKYFDVISDGNNITNSKPNPEVFIKAAEGLNLSVDQCIVVEDANSGIDAAFEAKMISVGIGEASNYEKTDFGISNILEIIEILNNKL